MVQLFPVLDIDIHELLLQQEPFVMIDKLEYFEMKKVVSTYTVPYEGIFVENGRLNAAGILENIAQTCAARIGYINKYILKRGLEVGVLAAVRDMKITEYPKVGDLLTTTIEVESEIFDMIKIKASVYISNRHNNTSKTEGTPCGNAWCTFSLCGIAV